MSPRVKLNLFFHCTVPDSQAKGPRPEPCGDYQCPRCYRRTGTSEWSGDEEAYGWATANHSGHSTGLLSITEKRGLWS